LSLQEWGVLSGSGLPEPHPKARATANGKITSKNHLELDWANADLFDDEADM
jgi:hypothetical protein